MNGYPITDDVQDHKWRFEEREYELRYELDGKITIYTQFYSPTMTESYKSARSKIYTYTGLWIPEVLDVDPLESSYVDDANKELTIDIPGSKGLFNDFVYAFNQSIKTSPTREEPDGYSWVFDYTNDDRNRHVEVDLDYLENSYISVHSISKDYFTVALAMMENGEAKITYKDNDFESDSLTVLEGEKVTLTASPNMDYQFVGWFIENKSISTANPYEYTVGKNDVTVQAKFEAIEYNMTETYRKARMDFYQLTSIAIPAYEGLDVDYQPLEEDSETYIVSITGGTNLSSQTFADFKAFFNETLIGWSKQESAESTLYTSKYNETIDLSWDNVNTRLTISADFPSSFTVSTYELGCEFVMEFYGVQLPSFDGVIIEEASFDRDGGRARFVFNKDAFTKNSYLSIKNAITNATTNPAQENDNSDDECETNWNYNDTYFELSWTSSTKTISLAIDRF